jgi:hypothetical protein
MAMSTPIRQRSRWTLYPPPACCVSQSAAEIPRNDLGSHFADSVGRLESNVGLFSHSRINNLCFNWRRPTNITPLKIKKSNEEPAWKLTQKVALTHSSVKNNECDVTYVLKEPRHRYKCVIQKAWRFPLLCRCRRHHRVEYLRRVSD